MTSTRLPHCGQNLPEVSASDTKRPLNVPTLPAMISTAQYAGSTVRRASVYVVLLTFCSVVSADEVAIEPESVELGRPVEFERDIYPFLQANCLACHNKGKSEGDLNLEDAASMLKGSSSGKVVVPGKPDDSYLYNVAARIEESYMPPMPNEVQAKKLTPRQLGLLRQWILEGAKAGSGAGSAAMNWQPISDQLQAIYSVDVGPWGQYVAAGRAGNVTLYNLRQQQQSAVLIDPKLQSLKSPQQQTHRDYVHAIAFSPDGNQIATAGYRTVKLWQRGTQVQDLSAAAVAIRSNGSSLAVQLKDKHVSVSQSTDQTSVSRLSLADVGADRLLGIHGAAGERLTLGTAGGGIQLVQTADGMVVATNDTPGAVPTQAVSLTDQNRLLVLFEDGTLKPVAIDAQNKQLNVQDAVAVEDGPVTKLQRRGDLLLLTLGDQKLQVRNADTLQVLCVIDAGKPIASAQLSSTAKRVVAVTNDGTTRLWNSADGKAVAELKSDLLAVRHHQTAVREQAVRDARVTVVKAQVAEDEKRLKEQQDGLKKASEAVAKANTDLAEAKKKTAAEQTKVEAAKKELAAKADDAALKKKVEDAGKALKAAQDAVAAAESTLASANKGEELAKQAVQRAEQRVAERNKTLKTVEADATSAAEETKAAEAATKSAVKQKFACFVSDSEVVTIDQAGRVRIWNATDGSPLDVLPPAPLDVAALQNAIGLGRSIVVQHSNGDLKQVKSDAAWSVANRLGSNEKSAASAFADRILALAFSPDGKLLATGGGEASRSGELLLWNVSNGELIRRFEDAHSDTVYGVEFSRDGDRLASAAADKFVKVFDVATGKHVRSFEGHTHHVMDVSWKGDGTQLVSAGADNAIKVWNAETGEQTRTINTYSKQVTALNFVGMTDEFVSCSGDRRVFRHNAANGRPVREFKGNPDYVYSSAITADGSIVAAGGEDGVLRVWDGSNAKDITSFAP